MPAVKPLPNKQAAAAKKKFFPDKKIEKMMKELIEAEYGKKGTVPKEDADKFVKYLKKKLG